MVDKKYLKIGVAAMAVTALIIGLSVGLTQKNKNQPSTASASSTMGDVVYSAYDDSCSTGKSGKSGPTSPTGKSGKSGPTSPTGKSDKSNSNRQLYPGTEDFVEASPTQRRKLRADLINDMNTQRKLPSEGKSGKSGPTSPSEGKSGKSGPTSPSCGKSGKSNGGSGGDCAPTDCAVIFDPCATGKSGKSNGGGGKSGKSNGNGGSCGKSGKSNGSNPTDCAPTVAAPTVCSQPTTTSVLDTPAPVPASIVETPEPTLTTPEPTIKVTTGNSETVGKFQDTEQDSEPWRGDN